MEKIKGVIYCRGSDDKLTKDGERCQDIERQVEKLKAFAERADWEITKIYRDDGKSAYRDDYQVRPEFCQLMRDIKRRHVQRVLVEDLSRWFRRLEEGLRTLREASTCGCTVTSTQEGEIDVTAVDGWMKASMSLLFAEWASRSQAEKVKSGMDRRRKDKRKKCKSCGVVHVGRHPKSCECKSCLKRLNGK
ncbi:MAG: recombinase family protein [bacterium]|nr:recombinase family protein [bacterium]